jgi:hypothetical protein
MDGVIALIVIGITNLVGIGVLYGVSKTDTKWLKKIQGNQAVTLEKHDKRLGKVEKLVAENAVEIKNLKEVKL